jgi:hypothetical protein
MNPQVLMLYYSATLIDRPLLLLVSHHPFSAIQAASAAARRRKFRAILADVVSQVQRDRGKS